MARIRLSAPAQRDIAAILGESEALWGFDARKRYEAVILAGLRAIATDPHGLLTRDRSVLMPELRSVHLRHVRAASTAGKVAAPVHLIYFRLGKSGIVEIIRLLHERSEPARHLRGPNR
jgi:toxin ParE1/3/4